MNTNSMLQSVPPTAVVAKNKTVQDDTSGAGSSCVERPTSRRIVHVVTRLLRAGSEENTLSTCDYQIACGHDVYLVHGKDFDEDYASILNPRLHRIHVPELMHQISPWHDLAGWLALRRVYRDIRPHIVHTHQSKAGILGRLAALGQGCIIIHSVHIAHWLSVGRVKQALFVAIERYCCYHTHEIINVSDGVRDACLAKGIGREKQHHVIHSGMNVGKFVNVPTAPDWKEYITGWEGENAPFVVMMMAAFEPRKRQELFLQSFAPVLLRQPSICLVFCGEGARLQAARQLVRDLGIEEQVRFAGYIENPENYVALADLCVLASEREGLPRVLVQYVAGRRPVVVNHLAGVEIIIRDGYNGTVVPGDDIDETAREIERLFLDREALHAMGKSAASIDVSSWDIDRMGAQIQDVYDLAITHSPIEPIVS